MTLFRIGDSVKILKASGGQRNGTVGTLTGLSGMAEWPYEVETADGRNELYAADELERIDSAPGADPVNQPSHYRSHPSGIECIQIVKHMNFCLGNAIKYLWRADEKGNAIQDLEKAKRYIEIEIERRKAKEAKDNV